MAELRLVFNGGAEVFWQETYEGTDEGRQVTKVENYTASEPYFNQIVPVYGRGTCTDEMTTKEKSFSNRTRTQQ